MPRYFIKNNLKLKTFSHRTAIKTFEQSIKQGFKQIKQKQFFLFWIKRNLEIKLKSEYINSQNNHFEEMGLVQNIE